MTKYNIAVVSPDLRGLDVNGKENTIRGKHDYVFRSSITDEAQRLIEANDFEGSYMRHLSTGHAETQRINLAMLSLAERYDGIVGVTLDGLANERVAQSIIQLPAGRVLYEILEAPNVFKVSTDNGVEVPNFNDDYADVDVWKEKLFGTGMKLIPNKMDKSPNKQAERIKGNVYIELQPEFIANLGSVDMKDCPPNMEYFREITKIAKEQGPQPLRPSLVDKICSASWA